eukprot:TRINITY_DN494_c0_g2_i1.p2 TRINITY_DN494_c0_g2~~TRINITY_DN494_c0_g2_i1.p2  ORF type:complete len:403 (+),score=71.47 TRINITY_DN494_c0_g2_i1:202-1410(+)
MVKKSEENYNYLFLRSIFREEILQHLHQHLHHKIPKKIVPTPEPEQEELLITNPPPSSPLPEREEVVLSTVSVPITTRDEVIPSLGVNTFVPEPEPATADTPTATIVPITTASTQSSQVPIPEPEPAPESVAVPTVSRVIVPSPEPTIVPIISTQPVRASLPEPTPTPEPSLIQQPIPAQISIPKEESVEVVQEGPSTELTPQQIFEQYLQSIMGKVTKEFDNEFPLLPISWLEGLEDLGLVEYLTDGSGDPVLLGDLLLDTPKNDPELLQQINDFVALLELSGLDKEICKIEEVVTVLAPYNQALARMKLEDATQLANSLSHHIVLLPPSKLKSGDKVPTLQPGEQLTVTYDEASGRFTFVQEANTEDEHGAFVHYLDGTATPLDCAAVFVSIDDNLDPSR